MSKQKMRKQQVVTTKSRTIDLVKSTSIILGATIIIVAPFLHMFFPKKNAEVELFRNKLQLEIDKMKEERVNLDVRYENQEISPIEYISMTKLLNEKLNSKMDHNLALIDEKIESEKIFDWKTTRVFLIAFGVRLPYLLFSLIIFLLIRFLTYKSKVLRTAFNILLFTIFSISFYQLVWVFWPSNDYPIETYWWMMALISILTALATLKFLNWYKFKMERLYEICRNIFSFIFEEIDEEDYVKTEKKLLFKNKRVNLARQSMLFSASTLKILEKEMGEIYGG